MKSTWVDNRAWIIAIVYCAFAAWGIFLTQGLPFGDLDDWVLVKISKDTPWSELIANTLTPWSRSEYWFNQVNLFDQISCKRILNGIALKFAEGTFGIQFFPFFFFTKVLFFAGTCTLFSLFVYEVTRSPGFTLCGAIFFCLVPAHYSHALWISDPATIAQFFIILSFWIFYRIAQNLNQQGPIRTFLGLWGMLFLAGYLGIKTKEPALILPLTVGVYTVLHAMQWKTQKLKWGLLILLAGFLVLQIVPLEHLGAKRQGFNFSFENISRMLFRNHTQGYEDEPVSAFFSLQHIWPVSIARTFGFFSLWSLAACAAIYGMARFWNPSARERGTPAAGVSIRFLDHPLVSICALWALIEISLMGLFQPEPRYFSITMIPLTLLALRLVWCTAQILPRKANQIFLAIALFCWGWSTLVNASHCAWQRMKVGQRFNRYLYSAQKIYQDVSSAPEKAQDLWNVGKFYCPAYVVKNPQRPRMEDVVYFAELPWSSWNKTEDGALQDFERFAKKGAVYYVTSDSAKLAAYPRARLITTVSGINEKSLCERILYALKGKNPPPLYIYRHEFRGQHT